MIARSWMAELVEMPMLTNDHALRAAVQQMKRRFWRPKLAQRLLKLAKEMKESPDKIAEFSREMSVKKKRFSTVQNRGHTSKRFSTCGYKSDTSCNKIAPREGTRRRSLVIDKDHDLGSKRGHHYIVGPDGVMKDPKTGEAITPPSLGSQSKPKSLTTMHTAFSSMGFIKAATNTPPSGLTDASVESSIGSSSSGQKGAADAASTRSLSASRKSAAVRFEAQDCPDFRSGGALSPSARDAAVRSQPARDSAESVPTQLSLLTQRLDEINQIQLKSQEDHLEVLAQLMAAQRERNEAHAQEINVIRAQVGKLAETLTDDEAKENDTSKLQPPARELGELEA